MPTDRQIMAALIEEIATRFEVEVLDLETTDHQVTAILRVRTSPDGQAPLKGPPRGQVRLMAVEDLD
jgi:hypothetical protein